MVAPVKVGEIEYVPPISHAHDIDVGGRPLDDLLLSYLRETEISVKDPFDRESKQVKFVPEVEDLCSKIFDAIKQIRDKGDLEDAPLLGSRLYESFASYWISELLSSGRDVIGIKLWRQVLSITQKWEKNKKEFIHKGTPFFFLAENYLLVGDRDLGFQYLYSALLDDTELGKKVPSFNYPLRAPSYLTSTIKDDPANKMYPLVQELRSSLDTYILAYKQEYSNTFSINDLDKKFFDNKDLKDIVSFFVFNFMYLVESKNYGSTIDPLNEMTKLRNLDLIFNFCLIVDKSLELAENRHDRSIGQTHYFSAGIIWISKYRGWLSERDLRSLMFDLNKKDPDKVIPRLLSRKVKFKNKPIQRALHDLLVTYKFRNYGGHNIKQQKCLTNKFNDIIYCLFNSLFMAVELL
jgi:hypothetical protein